MKVKPKNLKPKTSADLRGLHKTLARSADLTKRRYTVPELRSVTRITPRQVRHWEEIELLMPSWRDSDARGSQPVAYYSARDVVKALMIIEMMQRGLTLKQVREVASNLGKKGLLMDESVKYLLTDGTSAYYAETPSRVVDILKHNNQMLLIPMHKHVERLRRFRLRLVA
jgi:DNA-binding transcriptional MerR regulator